MTQVQPATNVTRFGLDDILGNEVVDFAVLESNYEILGNNAAHTGQDNTFQGGDLFNVRQMVRAVMAGGVGTEVLGNAYYDGTAYQRYNVANLAVRVRADSGGVFIETSAPAANPITNWVIRFQVGANGVVSSIVGTLPPGGTAGQALVKNSATNYDAIWVPTSNVGALVFEAQNISGTTVTLLQPPMVNGIMGVYVNGQALIQTRDWTIAGSVITFTQALSGDDVHIEYLQTTSMGTDAASVDGLSAYPASNPQPNQLVGLDANGKLPQSTIPSTDNLLQNGGLELWHRGNGPFTGVGSPYSADSWWLFRNPATINISMVRDSVNVDAVSLYCAAVTLSGTGFGTAVMVQPIGRDPDYYWSGPEIQVLAGRTVTFSVRVKTTVAGAYARLWDGVAVRQGTAHTGSGQYETLTVTGAFAANATRAEVGVVFVAAGTYYVDNAVCVWGNTAPAYLPTLTIPDVITNDRVGVDLARVNLLTNGGFEVWQRGTGSAFSCPAGGAQNGLFFADRWQMFNQGSGAFSILADATNQDQGSWRSVQATVAAGATQALPAFIYQNFIASYGSGEGQEIRGRYVSLSVRVKTAIANGCRIGIYDQQGNVTFYSAYHSGGNTYETLRLTTSLPIALNCTNGQVRIFFEAAGAYYVDSAMLVIGSVAADYVPLHPADDLARCLRYYERFGQAYFDPVGIGVMTNATTANVVVPFKVPKATTPSITSSPAGIQMFDVQRATWYSPTSISIPYYTYTGMDENLIYSSGGFTPGQGTIVMGSGTSSPAFAVEGNP